MKHILNALLIIVCLLPIATAAADQRPRRTLIGLEYSYKFEDNMPEMAECVKFFNQLMVKHLPSGT